MAAIISPKSDLQEWVSQYDNMLLPVNAIDIDASYQRLETSLAIYISETFDPLAFGQLIIGKRGAKRQEYYVVDGQQRLKAARLLNFASVPCAVFQSSGKRQEAGLFRAINQWRKRVTKMEIFRAAITAKCPTALHILEIVREAAGVEDGYDIYLKDRQQPQFGFPYLSCITQLEKVYSYRNGPARLKQALNINYRLWPKQDEICRNDVIGGMDEFLTTARSFDLDRMRNRMSGIVCAEVVQRSQIWKAKQKHGSGFRALEAVAVILSKIYNSRAK